MMTIEELRAYLAEHLQPDQVQVVINAVVDLRGDGYKQGWDDAQNEAEAK